MNDHDMAEAIEAAVARRGKQASIAAETGWSEAKFSEMKSLLKRDGGVFLKSINLKVVPQDMVCVDKKKLETLVAFLQVAMPAITINQFTGE